MTLDVLTPSPLKLHVRAARAGADGQPALFELHCRMATTTPTSRLRNMQSSFTSASGSSSSGHNVEWTLWKTFEDFQAFDTQMRSTRTSAFARMMVPVAFAPEHKMRLFFHQAHTNSFVEKRRKELDYYMQRILMLSDIGDFTGGRGSSVLAEFLRATQHVACHSAISAPLADQDDDVQSLVSTTSSVTSISRGLRQLHVDLRRTYSPSASSVGDDDFDSVSHQSKARKHYKQEIEDALMVRGGDAELKVFKKKASAFRKENDAVHGAADFVAFVNQRYDPELASWLLLRFHQSLRNEEQRAALQAASGFQEDRRKQDKASRAAKKQEMQPPPPPVPSVTRKRSKKEVLAKVEKLAGGNADAVAAFKYNARALGNNQMSTQDFVAFLDETFGARDAQRILKLVAEVVPTRLQPELLEAVRRP